MFFTPPSASNDRNDAQNFVSRSFKNWYVVTFILTEQSNSGYQQVVPEAQRKAVRKLTEFVRSFDKEAVPVQ
jgi:hypothetical protein